MTDIRDNINTLLQSQGRPELEQTAIGKLVRDAFGPIVQRKKSKSEGRNVYKYFGLKKKVSPRSQESHLVDQTSQEAAPQSQVKTLQHQLLETTAKCENLETLLNEQTAICQCLQAEHEVHQIKEQEQKFDLLQQIQKLQSELDQQHSHVEQQVTLTEDNQSDLQLLKQKQSELEKQLRDSHKQSELQRQEEERRSQVAAYQRQLDDSHQQTLSLDGQLQELHQEHVMLQEKLSLSTQQAQTQIAQLQQQLEESFTQQAYVEQQLHVTRVEAEERIKRLHQRLQEYLSLHWGTITDQLDAELVSLRQVQGPLTAGPIDQSDKRLLHKDFSFKALQQQLSQSAPHLTDLLLKIGKSIDPMATTRSMVKDIHSLTALCVLAHKDSESVKGFQLLIGLMLVARAVGKQVITDLNHLGVSVSYSELLRTIEDTARAIDSSTDVQFGVWVVAYDNINIHKRVAHERTDRHAESWDFTSRIAVKVAHPPPQELLASAASPQGRRSDLDPHALLPDSNDDVFFFNAGKRYIKNLIVKMFKFCQHLSPSSNPRHERQPIRSVIHPMPLMELDCSFIDNNVTILADFQKRLAIDGCIQQCVTGDQATCVTIRGARRRRVAEFNQVDRLSWAKESPGDFHFLWECLKVIFLLFWDTPDNPSSLSHLHSIVNRSSVTPDAKRFQQADEFLEHALQAHLSAAALDFFNVSDVSSPLLSTHQDISTDWLDRAIEEFSIMEISAPTDDMMPDADHLNNFHRSFVTSALLYQDLRDAIRYDDGPGVIRHWKIWLLYFLASKRTNYSCEAANLLANLQADFSPWLSHIVIHNRTVNSTGKPGKSKPIDMAVEHHNLVIKNALRASGSNITSHHLRVISLAAQLLHDAVAVCDQEICSPFHSGHHTSTASNSDVMRMVTTLRQHKVTSKQPGRTLPSQKTFSTPISKGYHKAVTKQWIKKFLHKPELELDQEHALQEHHEATETLDDLQL